MLKNYLLVALRTLRRQRGYAALNVAGLALGLACCLLIGLYVWDEWSYDRHHERGAEVYRVSQRVQADGGEELWAWVGGALAEDLGTEYPELETVRVLRQPGVVRYAADAEPARARSFREEQFLFADEGYFDLFTHRALRGDPAAALRDPSAVILTESAAARYFGDRDPMGETLDYGGDLPLTVAAVIEDVPASSHLRFELLAPVRAFKATVGRPAEGTFDSYWWPFGWTYVALPDAEAAAAFQAKMPAFIDRNRRGTDDGTNYVPTLEPLYDLHLRSGAISTPGPTGSQTTVQIFLGIALAVLLLACVNFVNLATARSTQRAREVGVRKAIGARRGQLVGQFLGEAVLTSALALALGVVLVALLLPLFNDLTGKALSLGIAGQPVVWLGLLGVVAATGLLAGAYPALVLSGFRPARVLKGVTATGGGAALRKGLVVLQFAVSIALVAGTAAAFQQLYFLRTAALGFDSEEVVALRLPGNGWGQTAGWETVEQTLEAQPGLLEATVSTDRPGFGRGSVLPYYVDGGSWEEGVETPRIGHQMVGYDYFGMLGLEPVAGRLFSRALAADEGVRPDSANGFHVFERGLVLNETAARRNGWTPEEALGKELRIVAYENGIYYTDVRGAVVGVVEDHHHGSFEEPIEPVVFGLAKTPFGTSGAWALVKAAPGDAAETVATLRAAWDEVLPEQPFEASFLDADLDARYEREARVGGIVGAFAGLGLAIACLGLFGLAAYAAERRRKEVGVRKVLGATVPNLVGLLARDFLALVAVAAVLAAPLAYFAMERWLDGFAYRIDLGPLLFVGAGLAALAVALVTVSGQALRAATADPVDALRYE